jgi:hypothetical protein
VPLVSSSKKNQLLRKKQLNNCLVGGLKNSQNDRDLFSIGAAAILWSICSQFEMHFYIFENIKKEIETKMFCVHVHVLRAYKVVSTKTDF